MDVDWDDDIAFCGSKMDVAEVAYDCFDFVRYIEELVGIVGAGGCG